MYARHCWCRGIQPEEAFGFPVDDAWFTAALLAAAALDAPGACCDGLPDSSDEEQWLGNLH